MRRLPARTLLAGLLLAAAACARVPPPDLSADPAQLRDQVRAAQDRVRSCRGSARVGISSPEVSGSIDAWIAAEKPDRVRVELLDFFGNPAAVLVAGGGRFSLYDAGAGAFYRGEDTPENLRRLLPVPVGSQALAALVCGSVPLLPGDTLTARPGDGVMWLDVASPAGRQSLAVGPEATVRSARTEPAQGAGSPWSVSFDVFRHRSGAFVPTDAELEGEGASVTLHWKEDREVNGPVEADAFRLDPPRGARVVDLAADAAPPAVELPLRPATRR
jgi:hypothetical protein